MNRLLVALLATFDAVLAAAGGLAVALAPLTLLWVFALGGGADWAALWPASAAVWQLGHLVPQSVQLPETYLAATGIDPAAASFVLSLAPLGFAVFTALFAARSGGRAALAGTPLTGVVTGSAVFAAIAAAVALSAGSGIVRAELWQAVLFPSLIFAVPCLVGAVVRAWIARIPPVAALREAVEDYPPAWAAVPGAVARGAAAATLALVAVGASALAVAVLVRGGQVVALFQAGNVDALGASVLALGQLLYLPTLVVWALSFVAGPGFALGAGTAVSPAGTQLGVVPAVPVLGAVPDSTSTWLLLLALLPVAVGALTGWMLRARLIADLGPAASAVGPRVAIAVGAALVPAGVWALLAVAASGSMGPGRLAATGVDAGALALSVGVELVVGLGILLLAPTRARRAHEPDDEAARGSADGMSWRVLSAPHLHDHHEHDTGPVVAVPAAAAVVAGTEDAASGDGKPRISSPEGDDTAPIEPLPEPGLEPEPGRSDDGDAAEQPTEPIIDLTRGSDGGFRPGEPQPPR